MIELPTTPDAAVARARRAGDKIPDFLLRTPAGEPVRLSDALGQGPVVLVFVRGAWCPYCDSQLMELATRATDFRGARAQIFVIAPEAVALDDDNSFPDDLPLTVLLDPEQLVAEILGLTYRVDAVLRETLIKKLGVILPDRSGVARWELPVPSTFVVEQDGTVRAAWTSADPSVRPGVDEVLAALQG